MILLFLAATAASSSDVLRESEGWVRPFASAVDEPGVEVGGASLGRAKAQAVSR